jgi:hypothetical protein
VTSPPNCLAWSPNEARAFAAAMLAVLRGRSHVARELVELAVELLQRASNTDLRRRECAIQLESQSDNSQTRRERASVAGLAPITPKS